MARKLFVLLLTSLPLVTGDKCETLSTLPQSVVVDWWNIKPYSYTDSGTDGGEKIQGLFYKLLQKMNPSSNKLSYNPGHAENQYQDFKTKVASSAYQPNNTGNISVFLPVMIKKDVTDPCMVKVLHSRGPAYVVTRNELKPLTQLGHSFINGGQIIGLTLILTVISGVFMWILDHHKNPEDFPPSFILGSWQGFWWAFVTMTTVGYGDTAPKSIPARLYSILWMLLGMVTFSVLTANFTSSLTHEIDSDLDLFSKRVAVLNGSLTQHAAVSAGAAYVAYDDIQSMISALKKKNSSIKGILLDRHVAIAYETFKTTITLEIGRTVEYDYYIGMIVRPPENSTNVCEAIKECAESILQTEEFEATTLKLLSESVNVETGWNESSSLFDDYEFLIILLAMFSVLVGGGLIWEYFYYKPKMQRLNKVDSNEDLEMDADDRKNNTDKAILWKNEVDDLCEECKAKVESIMKQEGKNRLQSLHTGINPLDGFSIIGNQLSSIPGVSSIRKIGSELPHNVGNLRKKRKRAQGKLPPVT